MDFAAEDDRHHRVHRDRHNRVLLYGYSHLFESLYSRAKVSTGS
jgi:hypothetical protein